MQKVTFWKQTRFSPALRWRWDEAQMFHIGKRRWSSVTSVPLLGSQLTSFASFLWELASLGPSMLAVMPLDAPCLTREHVPLIFHWLPHRRWEHDRNKHLRFTVQRVQLWIIVGRPCGTHSIMLESTLTACLQDFWAQEVQKLNQNHYFIRRGEATPPSYPNKDLRSILDPRLLVLDHFPGHMRSKKFSPASERIGPASVSLLPCPLATESTVAGMFLLPNGRQQLMFPWCNPRIKRVSVLALAQPRGLFTQDLFTRLFILITCEHDSGAHVQGKGAQTDLKKNGWQPYRVKYAGIKFLKKWGYLNEVLDHIQIQIWLYLTLSWGYIYHNTLAFYCSSGTRLYKATVEAICSLSLCQ